MRKECIFLLLFLKRISWCGSRGLGEKWGERGREDKGTAALSPSEAEMPAACAERPSQLSD